MKTHSSSLVYPERRSQMATAHCLSDRHNKRLEMVKNPTNAHLLAIRIVTFLQLWRTPPNSQLLTFSHCPHHKLARRFSVPHNEMGVGARHEEIPYSCVGDSRRTGRLGHRLCCGTFGPAASAKTRFTFRPRKIRDETSLNHSCARTIATTTKRRVN